MSFPPPTLLVRDSHLDRLLEQAAGLVQPDLALRPPQQVLELGHVLRSRKPACMYRGYSKRKNRHGSKERHACMYASEEQSCCQCCPLAACLCCLRIKGCEEGSSQQTRVYAIAPQGSASRKKRAARTKLELASDEQLLPGPTGTWSGNL